MGHADLQHHGDVRRRDGGQSGDLPDVIGAHLRHQVPGVRADLQRGQRQADLIVERADGGDRLPHRSKQRGQHVLGGGLAHRAGDADDGERRVQCAATFDVVLRQGSQGGHRVRHDDLRHRGVHLMRHQRHGGAALRGAPHEIVAIHPFPGDGDEDARLTDLAGIGDGTGRHGLRCGGNALRDDQTATDRLGDLGQRHRHHRGFHSHIRSSPSGQFPGHAQRAPDIRTAHTGRHGHGDGQ